MLILVLPLQLGTVWRRENGIQERRKEAKNERRGRETVEVGYWLWTSKISGSSLLDASIKVLIFASPDVTKINKYTFPFFFFSLVQADAEQGADSPVRDEPLGEPGVWVHLQHLPGWVIERREKKRKKKKKPPQVPQKWYHMTRSSQNNTVSKVLWSRM